MGNFLVEVISDVEEKNYINKYEVKILSINKNVKFKNTRLIMYTSKQEKFNYGDILSCEGVFENAEENQNYKGFNYRRILWQDEIYGILQVEKCNKLNNKKSLKKYLHDFKNFLEFNLETGLASKKAGFLKGILLGNTNDVENDIKEDFKNSNLSHVLAISGMHISYIVIIINQILKIIKSYKIKKIISIISIYIFLVLVDSPPSCIRAVIMFSLSIIAELLYRKPNTINNFYIALSVILLKNPLYIENIGVWLSFGGTFAIIFIYKKFEKIQIKNKLFNFILQNFLISICVQIIIFPIILYNFNTGSLTFFISNIFISFFIPEVFFIGFFICCFPRIGFISNFFIKIENYLLDIIFYFTNIIGNLKLSKIYIKTPSLNFVLIYWLILFLFVNYKTKIIYIIKRYFKTIIIVSIILVCSANILGKITQKTKIFFVNVGQGDCTLIITKNNKKILIDGGEGEKDGYDNGKNVLIPYLLDRGVTKLDYIIISHFDSDHCRRNIVCNGRTKSKESNNRNSIGLQ